MPKAVKTSKLSIAKNERPQLQTARLTIPKNCVAEIHFHIGDDSYRAQVKDVSSHIINIVMVQTPLWLSTNQSIEGIQLLINHGIVYRGKCRVIEESTKGEQTHLSLHLSHTPISLNHVKAAINSKTPSQAGEPNPIEVRPLWSVQEQFKALCADFLHLLTDLSYQLSQEEVKIDKMNVADDIRANLENQVLEFYLGKYSESIRSFFADLQKHVSQFDTETYENHKKYFRTLFKPHLLSTEFLKNFMRLADEHGSDYGHLIMFYEMDISQASLFD
jgi:hypothetical protein